MSSYEWVRVRRADIQAAWDAGAVEVADKLAGDTYYTGRSESSWFFDYKVTLTWWQIRTDSTHGYFHVRDTGLTDLRG